MVRCCGHKMGQPRVTLWPCPSMHLPPFLSFSRFGVLMMPLLRIHRWSAQLVGKPLHGPGFGYFTNAPKTWLVCKEHSYSVAVSALADTNVNITSVERTYLGVLLGTQDYVHQFVTEKVGQWSLVLSSIAQTQPHSAFAAFTHGMGNKSTFLSHTIPNIGHLLQPPDTIIRTELISFLTRRPPPNNVTRDLFALPPRLGGLGLTNPSAVSDLNTPPQWKYVLHLSHWSLHLTITNPCRWYVPKIISN